MHAELAHDVLRVDQHVEQMRHRRALVAPDIGHTRLQQRLGDREDAFAAEGLAVAELERLHFFLERAFHARSLRQIVGVQTILAKSAYICEGSQSAIIGNAIRITSRIRSVTMNGNTPLKIVAKDASFTTLLMTKTFMPTGGWIKPSSTVITMITPNQLGSKPRCEITGKMIGTVKMIMAIASIRQPSTRYITMMRASTP